MDSNLNKIALDLYGKLQTRFSNIKIGDENAVVLSKKQDIPKARFFEFEFTDDGESLGMISVTLDKDDGVVLYVSGDLVSDTQRSPYKKAYGFIRSMRQFAKRRLLKFDIQNIGKSNMDRRDYQFQSKGKEVPVMPQPQITESKMYGSSRISYQDLGEARLVIKHNQPIVNPDNRSMNIDSIYIENAQGERFKYPLKHLNGARALAEHVKNGGIPYDNIGKYIIGLSEELRHLGKFKGFVSRQTTISEAMGNVTDKVVDRIINIRKEINNLQRPSFYQQFSESFQPRQEKVIPEDLANEWVDRLTIRTFNEELKQVFPYLYNIIDESDIPVKSLTPNDLLDEEELVTNNITPNQFDLGEEFASIIEGIAGENNLFSPNISVREEAIKKLNEILSTELPGGPNGVNAIESLVGIIDDPALSQALKQTNPDIDSRAIIQAYIVEKDPSIASRLVFGNEESMAEPPAPEVPPAAEPESAAPPAPAEQTPPEDQQTMENLNKPFSHSFKPSFAKKSQRRRQLQRALVKSRNYGATLETKLDFGHKVMTIAEALEENGLSPMECGFAEEYYNEEDYSEDEVRNMLTTIEGFWNTEENDFVTGGTRVKIKIIKDFKDGSFPNATENDLKEVLRRIENSDPSSNTHNEIERVGSTDNLGNDMGSTKFEQLMSSFQSLNEDEMSEMNNQPASNQQQYNNPPPRRGNPPGPRGGPDNGSNEEPGFWKTVGGIGAGIAGIAGLLRPGGPRGPRGGPMGGPGPGPRGGRGRFEESLNESVDPLTRIIKLSGLDKKL